MAFVRLFASLLVALRFRQTPGLRPSITEAAETKKRRGSRIGEVPGPMIIPVTSVLESGPNVDRTNRARIICDALLRSLDGSFTCESGCWSPTPRDVSLGGPELQMVQIYSWQGD
ncbi:hypothetical protein BO94DRAFT_545457 [Aspergillus sclerotioniger CBS 115572]|uniref:Secreted protein n=1 Tax=Aspergillus sclerotioniger CBS 115572 TaxID=1450535 RepID=A0A317WSM8_9EURO|nr:hypothetical protein BO94DRAFT_545457 [Aspergillus sclerotioniger CBS 115572]PWY89464.1 hypothetical protein BO94DRAFT_545457 [Aspergillus sclerotioniger CBS 115572]